MVNVNFSKLNELSVEDINKLHKDFNMGFVCEDGKITRIESEVEKEGDFEWNG